VYSSSINRKWTKGCLLLAPLLLATLLPPPPTRAEEAAVASVYVREDSNDTTVISPRLRLRAQALEATHLDLSYTVDVWTSASVDIVSSASTAVTEQRDEYNVGLDHALEDLTLRAGYRASIEPDYVSHGGSAGLSWDLADNAANLSFHAGGYFDSVGRAGDEGFAESVGTLAAGLSFSQVLDPETLIQVLYDLSSIRGYQASPYRFIGIGGDGRCQGSAPLCIPERNPRQRLRHAAALHGRRALGEHFSLGAGYRFYLDDWGILSHTGQAELAWAATDVSTVALSYRFYTQNAADHYKASYQDDDRSSLYFTRDKELSPLSSHRLGLEVDWQWDLPGTDSALSTALLVAPSLFRYSDFRLLDQITALEVTAVVGMEVP